MEAAAARSDGPLSGTSWRRRSTDRAAGPPALRAAHAGRRARAGTAKTVDVSEATAAACERWLAPAQRSGHELVIDEGDPIEVRSSAEDLAAMLDNLIENALHYSPARTRVTIGWRVEGGRVLGVTDEGPGIDESEREQVFERFYRVGQPRRRAGHGTGPEPGGGAGAALGRRGDPKQPARGRCPGGDRSAGPQLLTRS